MSPSASENSPSPELVNLIARAVRDRASGHVSDLRVDRRSDAIVVAGHSHSFYGLQLVIEAVKPYLHQTAACRVRLALDVRTPPGAPLRDSLL